MRSQHSIPYILYRHERCERVLAVKLETIAMSGGNKSRKERVEQGGNQTLDEFIGPWAAAAEAIQSFSYTCISDSEAGREELLGLQ